MAFVAACSKSSSKLWTLKEISPEAPIVELSLPFQMSLHRKEVSPDSVDLIIKNDGNSIVVTSRRRSVDGWYETVEILKHRVLMASGSEDFRYLDTKSGSWQIVSYQNTSPERFAVFLREDLYAFVSADGVGRKTFDSFINKIDIGEEGQKKGRQ